jgi:hypothetical protein
MAGRSTAPIADRCDRHGLMELGLEWPCYFSDRIGSTPRRQPKSQKSLYLQVGCCAGFDVDDARRSRGRNRRTPPGLHAPDGHLDRSMSSQDPTAAAINSHAQRASVWPQLGAVELGPCPSDLKLQTEFHGESEPEFAPRPTSLLNTQIPTGFLLPQRFCRFSCNRGIGIAQYEQPQATTRSDPRPLARWRGRLGQAWLTSRSDTVAANTNKMARRKRS